MPKYDSIDTIPAKTFFEILKTKNYQLLRPKSREKGLEEVFSSIYDDFFLKSDNDEAKEYLRLKNEISALEYKIYVLKSSIAFYYNNSTTKKMRLDFIKAFKEGFGIEINPDEDFTSEVHRIITIELGIIENDLALAKIDFENMINKSQSKGFDYFDAIVGLSNVLPNNSLLKEEMTLATYISLEKASKRIISKQNTKKLA